MSNSTVYAVGSGAMPAKNQTELLDGWRKLSGEINPEVKPVKKRSSMKDIFDFIGGTKIKVKHG